MVAVQPEGGSGGQTVTGATASVDANTGTPEVSVALQEGNLNFTFKNLKGETGAKGADGKMVRMELTERKVKQAQKSRLLN